MPARIPQEMKKPRTQKMTFVKTSSFVSSDGWAQKVM